MESTAFILCDCKENHEMISGHEFKVFLVRYSTLDRQNSSLFPIQDKHPFPTMGSNALHPYLVSNLRRGRASKFRGFSLVFILRLYKNPLRAWGSSLVGEWDDVRLLNIHNQKWRIYGGLVLIELTDQCHSNWATIRMAFPDLRLK